MKEGVGSEETTDRGHNSVFDSRVAAKQKLGSLKR